MTDSNTPGSPLITLASASPRRRELLDQIQVTYDVLPVHIDETHISGETAIDFVNRLARQKAQAGFALAPYRPVLGSDTIVVMDSHILGKPADRNMAIDMLNMLSGSTHQVMTAVALCTEDDEFSALCISEVEFAQLSAQQIEKYCQSNESADKAGAYAIQGIAAQFIKNINGSYSGIMGLPLFETAALLKQAGIDL